MGLLNPSTPKFETEDDAAAAKVDVKTEAAPAEKLTAPADKPVAAAQPASTAVAPKTSTAVAPAQKFNMDALGSYKDALRVDYNTLAQMTAQQGNIMDRESGTVLGDTVVFTLLSYQDSYVVRPGDDNAPDDLVRYSDDGVTCSDGTDVKEHIEALKAAGFPKAARKERVVVVGAVQSAAKTDKFNDTLVQFDLSPASRVQWKRYLANAAYQIGVGKATPESVTRVKASTQLTKADSNTFTLVTFAVAE